MQKQYIAIYKYVQYTIQDIKDMIEVYNVRYSHCDQTWDTPEDENFDYNIDISAEFDKAVQIACVEFEDENDDFGKYVEFDGMKLQIVQEGYSWFNLLQSFGWDVFANISCMEDFYNTEVEVQSCIENWIDSIAEDNAWKYIKNIKYGDY